MSDESGPGPFKPMLTQRVHDLLILTDDVPEAPVGLPAHTHTHEYHGDVNRHNAVGLEKPHHEFCIRGNPEPKIKST